MLDQLTKNINKAVKGLDREILRSLKRHEKEVVGYITKVQLLQKGEDGLGISLGEYAPFTVNKKLKNTDPRARIVSHITLFEEGDYHKSHKLSARGLITAKTQKPTQDLAVEFGDDILSLSEEGEDAMNESFVRDDIQDYFRKKIC